MDLQHRLYITTALRDQVLLASRGPLPSKTNESDERLWRWMPWLLSFTGLKPAEIARARGKDFLKVIPLDGNDVFCFERTRLGSPMVWPAPLHPRLIGMGLLDLAKQYEERFPFLPEGDGEDGAAKAVSRYRRRLCQSEVMGVAGGPVLSVFTDLFANELLRAGTTREVVSGLLGRRVEPSKFSDWTGAFRVGVSAISRMEVPTIG